MKQFSGLSWIALAAACGIALAGCGQRGPLVLPQKPAAAQPVKPVPVPSPVPTDSNGDITTRTPVQK